MSPEKPEQGPPEGLENQMGKQQEKSPQNLQLDLMSPESQEFIKLRQKLIEQSGCPDIEKTPLSLLNGWKQQVPFESILDIWQR